MRRIVCGLVLLVCLTSLCCRRITEHLASKQTPADVVAQLKSQDPDLRRDAVERLSDEKWGRDGEFLKAYALLAQDPDHTVRSAALRALGCCGDADYIKDVIAALKDPVDSVRYDAASALDLLVHADAIAPLGSCVSSDASVQVRAAAARALRHYPRADVLEILLACLSDRDVAVRHQASESLAELTGKDAGMDTQRWEEILADKVDPFAHPTKRGRKLTPPPTTSPAS